MLSRTVSLSVGMASALIVLVLAVQVSAQGKPPHLLPVVTIELPLTEYSICSAASVWGQAAKVLTGVECFWAPVELVPGRNDRVVDALDLTGMEVAPSLELLISQLDAVEAKRVNDLVVFRPSDGQTSMLDRVVPQFSLRNASLVEAADAVSRIFDAAYQSPPRTRAGGAIRATSERAHAQIEQIHARYNERFVPSITIQVANVTVLQILGEIAKQAHVSWRVQYVRRSRQYQDSVIEFLTAVEPVRTGPARVRRPSRSR
jgi:hypothetical protein